MDYFKLFSKIELIDTVCCYRKKGRHYTKKRNFNVLSLRTSGEALFTYNNEDIKVTVNDLLFIPKNIEYSQSTQGENVVAIHFKGNTPFDSITLFDSSTEAVRLFTDIQNFWQLKTEFGYYMAHCRFYELLAIITPSPDTTNDKISIGYKTINASYKNPELKISDIAAELKVSNVYFRREFKKRYILSPKQQLLKIRMENAALLLTNGYCTVSEAAIQSGFSDSNYFSTAFKKTFGFSPKKYAQDTACQLDKKDMM